MKLRLNGIELMCILGEQPHERTTPQKIRVDIELDVDERAADSDNLADAVDYVRVKERVCDALSAGECRLLERAAKLACEVCVAEKGVVAAKATVEKFGAVAGLQSAAAEFSLKKNLRYGL